MNRSVLDAEQVRARLRAAAEPAFRASLQRFFPGPVEAYGVRTPVLRRIACEIAREIRDWPAARRNRLCTELWKGGKLEDGAIAIDIYARFGRGCGHCEFHLFEKWIDRFVNNWGACDGICCSLIAVALENDPALAANIESWAASKNRWKRRAAAASLVKAARRGQHLDAARRVVAALQNDPEPIVRKAARWLRSVLSIRPGAGPLCCSRLVARPRADRPQRSHRLE